MLVPVFRGVVVVAIVGSVALVVGRVALVVAVVVGQGVVMGGGAVLVCATIRILGLVLRSQTLEVLGDEATGDDDGRTAAILLQLVQHKRTQLFLLRGWRRLRFSLFQYAVPWLLVFHPYSL